MSTKFFVVAWVVPYENRMQWDRVFVRCKVSYMEDRSDVRCDYGMRALSRVLNICEMNGWIK